MEYEIKCECLKNHKSLCQKVLYERGLLNKVAEYSKQLLSGGHVCVCYQTDTAFVGENICRSLEKVGFKVDKIVLPAFFEITAQTLEKINNLEEDVRLIVGIGSGTMAEYVSSSQVKKLFLVTAPSTDSILYYDFDIVLVDIDVILTAEAEAIAAGYGELFSKYVGIIDFKSSCFYSNGEECRYLIAKIENRIETFFLSNFERGSAEFTIELTNTLLQVGIYISMLKNIKSINEGAEASAKMLQKYCETQRRLGEVKFLTAYYILTTYKQQLKNYNSLLYYPCDKVEEAKTLEEMCKQDLANILASIEVVDGENIMLREHVFKEYSEDFCAMLENKTNLFESCAKTFRRIYNDAGMKISKYTSIFELAKIVSSSSILIKGYNLLKHFKEIGVV